MVVVVTVIVELVALRYSTARVQETMHQDATLDCLVEAVFGCSKAGNRGEKSRHAKIVHYIIWGAMFLVMMEAQVPVARHPEADYQCELAMTAAVKRDAMAQNVMMDCLDGVLFG